MFSKLLCIIDREETDSFKKIRIFHAYLNKLKYILINLEELLSNF